MDTRKIAKFAAASAGQNGALMTEPSMDDRREATDSPQPPAAA